MHRRTRVLTLAVIALTSACGEPTALPAKTITITNYLNSAFDIRAYVNSGYPLFRRDSVQVARIPAGGQVPAVISVEVPRRLQSIFAVAEPVYDGTGAVMQTDLTSVQVIIAGPSADVAIRNVLDGYTVFRPVVRNMLGTAIRLELVDDVRTRCLPAVSPGATSTLGYYAFRPVTELRYYADTTCTGPFRRFPHDTLVARLVPNSGVVSLSADSLP